jgi:hypothetical protein
MGRLLRVSGSALVIAVGFVTGGVSGSSPPITITVSNWHLGARLGHPSSSPGVGHIPRAEWESCPKDERCRRYGI